MDYPGLEKMLELHEGNVPYVYKDSLGYDTIGIGFLVDKKKGGQCPPEVISFWLNLLLGRIRSQLEEALPFFHTLSTLRQDILVDMSYNLGVPGLLSFHATLESVKTGQYADAAAHMLQSKWATQVGRRAIHLAHLMEHGEWEPMPA